MKQSRSSPPRCSPLWPSPAPHRAAEPVVLSERLSRRAHRARSREPERAGGGGVRPRPRGLALGARGQCRHHQSPAAGAGQGNADAARRWRSPRRPRTSGAASARRATRTPPRSVPAGSRATGEGARADRRRDPAPLAAGPGDRSRAPGGAERASKPGGPALPARLRHPHGARVRPASVLAARAGPDGRGGAPGPGRIARALSRLLPGGTDRRLRERRRLRARSGGGGSTPLRRDAPGRRERDRAVGRPRHDPWAHAGDPPGRPGPGARGDGRARRSRTGTTRR